MKLYIPSSDAAVVTATSRPSMNAVTGRVMITEAVAGKAVAIRAAAPALPEQESC